MAEIERCKPCGHAMSRHNESGHCSVSSKSKGECPCDGSYRYVGRRLGDRVVVEFGRGWSAEGVITKLFTTERGVRLATVLLDYTVELPEHLGGGWCREIDREPETLENLRDG